MATHAYYSYTAHLVLSSEHAGLKPIFRALESEMYRALARIEDSREVVRYLNMIRAASAKWLADYEREHPER